MGEKGRPINYIPAQWPKLNLKTRLKSKKYLTEYRFHPIELYTHIFVQRVGEHFFFIDTTPVIESSQGTVVEAVAAFGLGGRASLQ